MANNDSVLIPYVIQEGSFWYVAYKEKAPVPEIVVSSKGVANGLSEEYNDGWDFGPDSYSPTSTSAIPYTQTAGWQEAQVYASQNKLKIQIKNGIYKCEVQLVIGEDVTIEGENAGTVDSDINLVGGTPTGVVIQPTFSSGDAFVISPSGTYPIQVNMKNIAIDMSLMTSPNYGIHVEVGSSTTWSMWQSKWDNIWVFNSSLDYHSFRIENAILNQYGALYSIGGAAFSWVNTIDINSGNSVVEYIYAVNTYSTGTTTSNFIEFNGRSAGTGEINLIYIGFMQMNSPAGAGVGATYNSALYLNYFTEFKLQVDDELYSNTTDYRINFDGDSSCYDGKMTVTGYLPSTVTSNTYSLIANSDYSPIEFIDQLSSAHYIRGAQNFIVYSSPFVTFTGLTSSYNMKIIQTYPPTISTPSVPASGSSSQNTNPYSVKVYINGGALTEIQITINGTAYTVYSNSTASAVYEGFTVPVGASITLTYTTAPTWEWLPE